jgi:CHAT domain-containing protein
MSNISHMKILLLLAAALLAATGHPSCAAGPSPELAKLQEAAQRQYREGAYADALKTSEAVIELTRKEFGPQSEQIAIQEYGAGLVAERAGAIAAAERHFARSVGVREAVYGRDSPVLTEALARLGAVLLRQGKVDEAEPLLQRTLKLRGGAVGYDHSFAASAHAGIGDVALARKDYGAALSSYRRAVAGLTAAESRSVVTQSIAEQDIRRNREAFIGLSRAAWALRQANGNDAALLQESFAAGQQAWATSAAAALAKMTARLKAGDSELGRAIARVQDMAERVLALHQEDMDALVRWSAVQRADPAYSRLSEEFRKASLDQARIGAPVVQKQKVLIDELQDILKRCPQGPKGDGCQEATRRREAVSAELAALSAEAGKGSQELGALNKRLRDAEMALPGFAEFNAAREARIALQQRLEQDRAAARAAIVKAFPDFVSLTEPKPLTIAETQGLLGADETLVAILSGERASFVWVVTKERADWAEVATQPGELEADVAALRRGLDPQTRAEEAEKPGRGPAVAEGYDLARAHELYRKLFGAVGALIEGKRHLLLVPTGPLSSLPFQVLLTAPPKPDAKGFDALRKSPWLIRSHALTVLPSVPSLLALRRFAAKSGAGQPFLGIGDPVLIGPEETDQQRGVKHRTRSASAYYRSNGLADTRAIRSLGPLPETADELKAIGKALGAPGEAIVLREKATVSFIKSAPLASYRVIEFATHGLVAGDLGLAEPALVLTPPDQPTEHDDGLLTASEVAGLKLDADWVVLSACNTAAEDAAGADALSGLARAFLFAGARSLLVSHWPVNSLATVELTTGAINELAARPAIGKAEALRHAMLSLIDRGPPHHAHPSLWAPFVLVGEGAGQR